MINALVVARALGYAAACEFWPFTSCPRCDGSGKRRSPSRKSWRKRRQCKDSGTRIRIGRRIWTWLRRMYDDAT